MTHYIVGAFLWCCEVAYDAKGWVRKWWRRHIAMDEPKCRSCRHYVTVCDCTKVGLPVGRKVGRPTRRGP